MDRTFSLHCGVKKQAFNTHYIDMELFYLRKRAVYDCSPLVLVFVCLCHRFACSTDSADLRMK